MNKKSGLFTSFLLATAFVAAGAPRGALNNVPEAANYSLVYMLNIPDQANYLGGALNYDINLSGYVTDFSRIAYYLELQTATGTLNYLWVSMDAFTGDVTQIGVPTVASFANFQTPVGNMNVVSSVSGIVTGTGLTGGNIEFWPSNYNQQNSALVPNASDTVYDFGDNPTAGNYGSMQVHNSDAKQVLFAFNRWGGTGGTADVGIGNRPGSADIDWTFAQNAATYTVKTLFVYVLPSSNNKAPALAGATGLTGLTNVVLTFTKTLDDSATNTAYYALNGGLSVLGAALDPVTKQNVTLTTSLQQPVTSYTVTVNSVRDRTANHIPIAANTTATFLSSVKGRGATNSVPEAANYSLVYSLNIPNTPNYNNGITYDLDQRADISGFTRVAYYLELQQTGGPLNFIWVSMDAFTNNVNLIGVPVFANNATFQMPVKNMNVLSSSPDIVNGTNLTGGNIEFWPNDYATANAAAVPNASDSLYDWGDSRSTGGSHGSMQIHNHDVPQVLFAFNRWNAGAAASLGIGNQPDTSGSNPDWTFTYNSGNYSVKTLQVYVLPVLNTNPPVALTAVGAGTLVNVVLTFSKSLDDSATNTSNYALSGGVSVLSAALDPVTKATVTLTTTLQKPLTAYTITMNGLKDRTKNHYAIAANATIAFTASSARGVYNNAPEAADYTPVYSLNIPINANYSAGITYDVDNRKFVTDFTRIGYYLELQSSSGPISFIWVSMDAFTTDVNQIGVPTVGSGGIFQQPIANMNVLSSVPSIVNGTNMQGGNIEFWGSNYSAGNALGVPNASGSLYDWGDTITSSGNYGSMQVHNSEASQVLFAFNRWGGNGSPIDIGIGNQPTSNPDYTFANNAGNYITRTLQVFVLPKNNPPPVLTSAVGQGGWTNVVINFSKALSESATNVAFYSISGGLGVLGATLDPITKASATLTTSPQQPLASYTITVNGVGDRTKSNLKIAANSTITFKASPGRGVFANVPEAANYALVYSLNIPTTPNYSGGITYDLDLRSYVNNFTRLGYYLEVQTIGGPINFIWVSMETFATDVNQIGVPTVASPDIS